MRLLKILTHSTKTMSVVAKVLAAVVLIVGVYSLIPLLKTGFPHTHDGEGHIARLANYAVAVRQGHIPPRMAPTFWNGYGYPVFNFHYPLLSILGTPLVLVGIHPEVALKFWVAAAWVATWIGLGLFTKSLTKQSSAALVAVLVFMLNPYFYTLVYVRGSYGELLGVAAFVWLLWLVQSRSQIKSNSSQEQWYSLGVIVTGAVILLAHNIYATALFPLSIAYAWFMRKSRSVWQLAREFGIAVGLSLFFWLPALAEKKYVVFDDQFAQFYRDHFVQLGQLFNSNVTFGISVAGSEDTMSLGMGFASVVILVAASSYLGMRFWQKKKLTLQEVLLLSLLGVSLAGVFVMLPAARFLWEWIFVLPYYQFPWRFLGIIALLAASMAALLWSTNQRAVQLVLGVALLVNSVLLFQWYRPTFDHFPAEYYLNYFQTSTIYDELRAKTFSVEPGNLSSGQPEVLGTGSVSDIKWRGTYRTYNVQAEETVTVVEPTMYFPGWKVWANGSAVEVITTDNAPDTAAELQGQVAYTLPAGEWQVVSKITQQTPARLIGNSLTLLALLYVGWLGIQAVRTQSSLKTRKI